MYEFGVGDRVVSIVDSPEGNRRIHIGSTGVVCDIDGSISVEWDDDVHGHDCRGRCADGHGWWVMPGDIELYDGSDEPFEFDEDEFNKLVLSR